MLSLSTPACIHQFRDAESSTQTRSGKSRWADGLAVRREDAAPGAHLETERFFENSRDETVWGGRRRRRSSQPPLSSAHWSSSRPRSITLQYGPVESAVFAGLLALVALFETVLDRSSL